jgi:hypothetical protein
MPFGYCDLRWLHGVCTFFRGGRSPEFFWITCVPSGVFQRMLFVGFVPLPTLRFLNEHKADDQGQFNVDAAAFKSFDFNTEKAAGSFFPSSASYIEQRFKNENGSVSQQFNIAVFMPVTLGDGTLSIEVDNLVVTNVGLGGIACSAGN